MHVKLPYRVAAHVKSEEYPRTQPNTRAFPYTPLDLGRQHADTVYSTFCREAGRTVSMNDTRFQQQPKVHMTAKDAFGFVCNDSIPSYNWRSALR